MNGSKRSKRLASLFAIILCLALTMAFVFAFAGCDIFEASGDDNEIYENDSDEEDGKDGDGEDGDLSEEEDNESGSGDEDIDEGIKDADGHVFPEIGEDLVGEDVVIIENENVTRTSGFDENGVAMCKYYYPSNLYNADTDNPFYGCVYCRCECLGHDMYVTTDGAVEYTYPLSRNELEITNIDGSPADINSDIKVYLKFSWSWGVVEMEDYYYTANPLMIVISSRTGEPLEIESVDLRQYVYYRGSGGVNCKEYHSESGLASESHLNLDSNFSTDYTLMYELNDIERGEFTVYITMTDGSVYMVEFWYIGTDASIIGSDIIYVD